MPTTSVYRCESCSQTTSRMYGVAVGVVRADDRDSGRAAVLGYCLRHRDEVVENFLAEVGAGAQQVQLLTDPPVQLRPAEAREFLAMADELLGASVEAATGVEGVQLRAPGDVPAECPHCGGELSWGTGPHVRDAARREHSVAWECLGCRAAGMLTAQV